MLRELTVRDLALIERARVAFGPGLTVITGETGAGKSLLIDALGLVMGERADSGLVRHGAAGARVEALFERDGEPRAAHLRARGVRRGAQRGAHRRRDGHRRRGWRPWSSRSSRSTASTSSSGCCRRRGSATCSTRSAGTATCAQRSPTRVEALRANEAALRELAIDPDELERRLELAEHAADEIEAAAPRDGEVEELRGRLARGRQRAAHRGAARRGARAAGRRGPRRARSGWRARRAPRPSWPGSIHRPQALAERARRARGRDRRRRAGAAPAQESIGEAAARCRGDRGAARRPLRADAQVRRDRGRSSSSTASRRARRSSGCATSDAERARRAGRSRTALADAARAAAAELTRRAARPRRTLAGLVTERLVELGFPSAAFVVARGGRARSITAAPTRSRSCSRQTRASRRGRWRASRPAARCRASRWRSRPSSPAPTRRRR